MNRVTRLIAAVSGAVFAGSFFLPSGYFNTPLQRLKWAMDSVMPLDNLWMSSAYVAVAVIVLYPYVWALTAVVTNGLTLFRTGRAIAWPQFVCQVIGGTAVVYVATLLLVSGDTHPSRPVQIVLIVGPLVLVSAMALGIVFLKPDKRLALITALGFLPQIPAQWMVAREVSDPIWGGQPKWGFVMAGVAAAVGFIAASVELLRRRPPEFEGAADGLR